MKIPFFATLKRKCRTARIARSARESLKLLSPSPSPVKTLVKEMQILNIDTVFDVGANIGQFGVDLRRNGYKGNIISFEPVLANFHGLELTSFKDNKWRVFHKALGERSGIFTINISGNNGLSSSLLPMGYSHAQEFPESRYEDSEEVICETLLEQFNFLGVDPKTTLLKMDVQGFESKVLLGGLEIVPKIPLCYFEASLSPLYQGEASFLELLNLLDSLGHQITDVFRGTLNKQGQLLQVDVISSSVVG